MGEQDFDGFKQRFETESCLAGGFACSGFALVRATLDEYGCHAETVAEFNIGE